MWLLPQYVTEALTKHAGRWPRVLVTLGRYPSKVPLCLMGEFGMIYVLLLDVADPGAWSTGDGVG